MAEIEVTRIADSFDGPLPACLRIRNLVQRIESRAYELFLERGEQCGDSLGDWVQAEKEQAGHARAALHENARGYAATFSLPGFLPTELSVAITPLQLGVEARSKRIPALGDEHFSEVWKEFSEAEAYRRIEFPEPVDTKTVRADLKNGILRVSVDKQQP